MIVPTYNDEQILHELLDDWPSVKRKAKKLGEKLMKTMPKSRFAQELGKLEGQGDTHRTKNGNTWSICAYCQTGAKTWWSVCYCEVENDYGTKSYYYLRGVNTPHPYYVELIPHAIRRLRERFINTFQEAYFAERNITELVSLAVFDRHECGIFFKAGKIRHGLFEPFSDGDGNTPGVVLMQHSMFYARMTPYGNIILKTFITPDAKKDTPKNEFTLMLFGIYKTFNMPKGKNSEEERTKILAGIWQTIPTMRHHLDYILEKVVPMLP